VSRELFDIHLILDFAKTIQFYFVYKIKNKKTKNESVREMKLYLGTKWFIQRVFFIYLALIFVLIFILVALVLQLYILI
jgi:lipopolysaccharide/colanic/teichoic acid biosynthesis glycosyltransferase